MVKSTFRSTGGGWTGGDKGKCYSYTSSSCHYFLRYLCPSSSGPCWLFILFHLLLLSHVSEECPNTCQCKWVSGKESVSCFRAGLTKIPDGLDPGTQVLNMSGNGLKSLPGYVFLSLNLLNLQKIFLSDCELVSMDPEVFSKLTNLVELELSGNDLMRIPSETFAEIQELRELKLNSNPISRIPNDAFLGLRRLVRLELTNCHLASIDTWAFRQLPALEWLRLDNNRLLTVQAESFFPLQNLHGLKISGNPWNCSCSLKPLRVWMLKNNVPFEGIPPICQEPGRLRGKPWDRLQLEDFACLPKLATLAPEERIRRTVEGHNTTFICRLQATSDTHVSWTVGSRGVPVTNGSSSWSGGGSMVLSESFVSATMFLSSPSPLDEDVASGNNGRNSASDTLGDSNSSSGNVNSHLDRSLGIKSSMLTIIRTSPRDAGLYVCRGESRAGSVAANFSLVVLQNKAENLTGRLLFTGTLVAVILTVIVCLLLSCVCLVGRHRHQHTTAVINHHQDKIELNHISGQNGGQNFSNHNSTSQYNHTNNISSPGTAGANSVVHRSRPPERNARDYKALPTTDPEENERDLDCWDNPSSQANKVTKFELVEQGTGYDNASMSASLRALSPSPSSTAAAAQQQPASRAGNKTTLTAREQSTRDKFPDLIDEKISVPSAADFVSLPRPNRNLEHIRPSYFHRRMNSESQSPLLSAYYSYSNSFDSHSLTSSESLAYPSSGLGPHQHNSNSGGHQYNHPHSQQHPSHHYSHHHSTSSIKYNKASSATDRLSMPTSPLHDPNSSAATYDYHAAQLAAFLEEYRVLQLELMRMSASLNRQQSPQDDVIHTSTSTSSNNLAVAGASSNTSSSSQFPTRPPHESLLLDQPGTSSVSSTLQPQQQLKSILKNPTQNNNSYVT